MYDFHDMMDADGTGASEVVVPSKADLAWARAMLESVRMAPTPHLKGARFEEMVEGACESVARTEAVIIVARRLRNTKRLRKSEGRALVLEMMALRMDSLERTTDLDEDTLALWLSRKGLVIPGLELDDALGDEIDMTAANLLDFHRRRIAAAFLEARGEPGLAKFALYRPDYLENYREFGLDSLLDGKPWPLKRQGDRKKHPRSAA